MIEARGLTKDFGSFRAVDDVSFRVAAGSVFGFLGPNGAGKTTTIKMLTTILRPTSGDIRLDGHDVVAARDDARRTFGIVFQDPSVDGDLTAFENMDVHGALYGVPRAERRARIERLLKFVELWDRRDDRVKKFSGGMTRRLEIARALLHEPKILFLDEPTVGLDPQTRNRIWDYLRRSSRVRGTTVFFTTHNMDVAERSADEVAIIDGGRLVAQGAPSAIKERTSSPTLEAAFIALTGHEIREEAPSSQRQNKIMGRMWGGRK